MQARSKKINKKRPLVSPHWVYPPGIHFTIMLLLLLWAINQQNQASSISSTSVTSLAPNCLFTCVSDEGHGGENVEQSSTSLALTRTGDPVSPFAQVGRYLSTPPTPKRDDPQFPKQGAAHGCHCPPLHCLHLLKHLRYLRSGATHLLFI